MQRPTTPPYSECSAQTAHALREWVLSLPDAAPHVDAIVMYWEGGPDARSRKWFALGNWVLALLNARPELRHPRPPVDEREPQCVEALTKLGWPERFTTPELGEAAPGDFYAWMAGPAGRRKIHALLWANGYGPDPNPNERQGRWFVKGRQVRAYRRRG